MASDPGTDWRSDTWALAPGDEVVPGCVMQSLLGGGRRHEVYAAFDRNLLTPVVVKIVRPGRVQDDSVLRATQREIEILRKVSHPVVVRLLDAMGSGPRPHLVLERVPGRTLYKVIHRDGPLTAQRAAELGVALASAIHAIHRHGYVHLDVKPENVILGRPPRVIDFGIAATVERARQLRGVAGTPRCAAPEQCEPPTTGVPGPASDIWGLGATLHEAVSRTGPFPAGSQDPKASLVERFPQLRLAPRSLPESVPGSFADLVLACLRPDPADRPSAEDLFYALAAIVGPRES